MAAAEGCVEGGLESGCCRLSLRMGEVFRDVLGLAPAEPLFVVGTSVLDSCFCNGGGATVGGILLFRDSPGLFLDAEVFAVVPIVPGPSSCPL